MSATEQDTWTTEQRAREIGHWAVGMVVATGRYLTHRVPLYRRNRRPGCGTTDAPDPERELPGDPGTLQRASAGIGPLYHRRYEIAFVDADLGCEEIITELRRDPNTASPTEVSRFERVGDGDQPLEVGDEMVVRLPGPWNGPVRVVDATPTSFGLVTLQGHMEAGEITFDATTNERGWTVFAIESWARAGDETFNLLYHRLAVARELQLHMWAHFCEAVVKLAGGIAMTNVELHSCTDE